MTKGPKGHSPEARASASLRAAAVEAGQLLLRCLLGDLSLLVFLLDNLLPQGLLDHLVCLQGNLPLPHLLRLINRVQSSRQCEPS